MFLLRSSWNNAKSWGCPWITLESPDLAITEAAVGAGVTSLLFLLTLKKIHAIDARNEVRRAHAQEKQNEQNGGADNGNA